MISDEARPERARSMQRRVVPFMAIGMCLGAAVGRAFDNIALGMSAGTAVGSVVGAMIVLAKQRAAMRKPPSK